MAQTFFNNTIIVRLHYKSSEIEFTKLDVRTTMTDKIANFGGTFGIWAELTGCSLLGMINLVIISFKLIFRSRNQKQELQCIYLASFHKEYFLSVFYFENKFTFLMELVFYKIEGFRTSKEITVINQLLIPLFEIHAYEKNKDDGCIFSRVIILQIEAFATSKKMTQLYHNSYM